MFKQNLIVLFILCRQGTSGFARRCWCCHGGSLWMEQGDHMCPQSVWRRPAVGGPVRGDDHQECQQRPHLQTVFCPGQLVCHHCIVTHRQDHYLSFKLSCYHLVYIKVVLFDMLCSLNNYLYFYHCCITQRYIIN